MGTFSALRGLALDLNLWAHGVDITVRPAESEAVETIGIWKTTTATDAPRAHSVDGRPGL